MPSSDTEDTENGGSKKQQFTSKDIPAILLERYNGDEEIALEAMRREAALDRIDDLIYEGSQSQFKVPSVRQKQLFNQMRSKESSGHQLHDKVDTAKVIDAFFASILEVPLWRKIIIIFLLTWTPLLILYGVCVAKCNKKYSQDCRCSDNITWALFLSWGEIMGWLCIRFNPVRWWVRLMSVPVGALIPCLFIYSSCKGSCEANCGSCGANFLYYLPCVLMSYGSWSAWSLMFGGIGRYRSLRGRMVVVSG